MSNQTMTIDQARVSLTLDELAERERRHVEQVVDLKIRIVQLEQAVSELEAAREVGETTSAEDPTP